MNIIQQLYISGLLLFPAIFSMPLSAQVAPGYEVATWSQFRTAAISYTFDDNTPNQLTVALPLFNQYGFKTTLFVITNRINNWDGYMAASDNGHEISSHTMSHPKLSTVSVAEQENELRQSQVILRENVRSAHCATMAYPNCDVGDIDVVKKYYIAARTCQGDIVPATPTDFYRISSIGTGTQSSIQTAQQFNDKANLARSSNGWCNFLIHAIDNEPGWSPTQSSALAGHLAFIDSNQDDFWVATFETVVKYIRERDALSITEIPVNAHVYKISVTDTLIDSVYNVPVTIKRLLPAKWKNANVFQNNLLLNSAITQSGKKKYIVFDVIPDKGDLILEKSGKTNRKFIP